MAYIIDKLAINLWTKEQPIIGSGYTFDVRTTRYDQRSYLGDRETIVVHHERNENCKDNPDLMVEYRQQACRNINQDEIFYFHLSKRAMLNIKKSDINKETVQRIDIAIDINMNPNKVFLRKLDVNGRFGGSLNFKQRSTGKESWRVWGQATNLQICIYDKKRDLLENYKDTHWGTSMLKKIGKKHLVRLEIRIGKKYLKAIENGNEIWWVKKNLNELVRSIVEKSATTNIEDFNKKIWKSLEAVPEKIIFEKTTKKIENTIKYHQEKLIRQINYLDEISKILKKDVFPDVKDIEPDMEVIKKINRIFIAENIETQFDKYLDDMAEKEKKRKPKIFKQDPESMRKIAALLTPEEEMERNSIVTKIKNKEKELRGNKQKRIFEKCFGGSGKSFF